MEGTIPALDPNKCLKTYGKADRAAKKASETKPAVLLLPKVPKVVESTDLTTKEALKFLLEGTLRSKVCRYCLKVASPLSYLDQIIQVAGKGALYKVSIKDIIASFHPFKVVEDPNFPDRICEKCLDRALTSYLFTQQCEQAERAIRNCFEDMYDKLEKLDPLERTKKRGRQKLHPNHNKLHVEHEKVINYADPIINIVNTSSEVLTEQTPISKLECLKCCEILPNLESLINHMQTHPKSMWFNCRLCGTSFPKRYNLKRHYNLKHARNVPPKIVEQNTSKYDCKKCGLVYDKYYDYLQHIEKHKFKTIMEHLVGKKMDKLCSLCFDKATEMVPLSEKICLHGGSPELTGDRSLYTVLASTLPEKKNKYRELLLHAQASIMQIVKKKNHGPNEYSLSNPIIIDKDDIDTDDLYLFFFSEPELLNSTKNNKTNNSVMTETKMNYDNGNTSSHNDSVTHQMEAENVVNYFNPVNSPVDESETQTTKTLHKGYNFTFSNPDAVNIDDDNKINTIDKPKALKNDGVFEDAESQEETDFTLKDNRLKNPCPNASPCNFCWLFGHLHECEYCKKPNYMMHNINVTDSTVINQVSGNLDCKLSPCKVCWVFKHLDKCEICGKMNSTQHKVNTRNTEDLYTEKDSLNAVKNIHKLSGISMSKGSTWQCNICLTYNKKNKKLCDCCDAKPLLNTETEIFKCSRKNINFDKVNNNLSTDKEEQAVVTKMPNPCVDDCKLYINVADFQNAEVPSKIEEIAKSPQLFDSINFPEEIGKSPKLFDSINFPEEIGKSPKLFDSINSPRNNDLNISYEEVSLMDTETVELESFVNFSQLTNIEQNTISNVEEEAMDIQIPELRPDLPNMEINITSFSASVTPGRSFDNNNTSSESNTFHFNVGWTDRSRNIKKKTRKSRY